MRLVDCSAERELRRSTPARRHHRDAGTIFNAAKQEMRRCCIVKSPLYKKNFIPGEVLTFLN